MDEGFSDLIGQPVIVSINSLHELQYPPNMTMCSKSVCIFQAALWIVSIWLQWSCYSTQEYLPLVMNSCPMGRNYLECTASCLPSDKIQAECKRCPKECQVPKEQKKVEFVLKYYCFSANLVAARSVNKW